MNKIFLHLGKQPLANNFQTKRVTSFYKLSLKFNTTNSLVSINKRVKKEAMFNKTYPYRSSQSLLVKKHFKKLAKKIKKNHRYKKVLEIGSNDGSFAKNFNKKDIICIEPCLDVANILKKNQFQVYTEYFDNKLVKKIISKFNNFDVIFSANTITHIDNINEVLTNVKKILSKNGVFILEEPSFLECFKKNAFDQFYNEHIYVLSTIALRNILHEIDLKIFKLENIDIHGGSTRYYITHKNNKKFKIASSYLKQIEKEKKAGLDKFKTYKKFAKNIIQLKKDLINIFKDIKSTNSKIVGYGASAKSVTVVNFCNLRENFFEYFLDTTKNKIGKYLPGTKILVKKYSESKLNKDTYYFLGAWNFKNEIFLKEKKAIKEGAKFILHLPSPHIYRSKKKINE